MHQLSGRGTIAHLSIDQFQPESSNQSHRRTHNEFFTFICVNQCPIRGKKSISTGAPTVSILADIAGFLREFVDALARG